MPVVMACALWSSAGVRAEEPAKSPTSQESEKTVDQAALEKAFVGAAASYSARKKISYAAWRENGVSAAVLKAAGISRAGS